MIPPVLFVAKKGFPFITTTKRTTTAQGTEQKKRESKVIQLT